MMQHELNNPTITAVSGLRVGHATRERGGTGCTVLLGPFRGACDARGLATGTRELETLAPTHLVPQIDAVLLTGGSAFGLAAADGVVSYVAEHGGGFDTGSARVPIVPAAVIFDLAPEHAPPDAALGRAACVAATTGPVAEGRVGAGAGATIGKLRGRAHADPGGIGSFALRAGSFTMGAIAVVNALGDVLDFDGRILAGARTDSGAFVDCFKTLSSIAPERVAELAAPHTNTTIAAIATDAPLSRSALQLLARAASCAIVRRVAPANTVFDGDVVFALSTASDSREMQPAELLALCVAAQLALERAILRAAQTAAAR
jgi:L-aminopeptidase/D-esterase-like protein